MEWIEYQQITSSITYYCQTLERECACRSCLDQIKAGSAPVLRLPVRQKNVRAPLIARSAADSRIDVRQRSVKGV